MVALPESAPAPALGAETAGAAIGSQTQPALFIITTNAPNFIPTLVQTCSHSVTRSFGVVSEVARAVSHPLRKRSAESAQRTTHLISRPPQNNGNNGGGEAALAANLLSPSETEVHEPCLRIHRVCVASVSLRRRYSCRYSTLGRRRTGCGYRLIKSKNSEGMSDRTGNPKPLAVSKVNG